MIKREFSSSGRCSIILTLVVLFQLRWHAGGHKNAILLEINQAGCWFLTRNRFKFPKRAWLIRHPMGSEGQTDRCGHSQQWSSSFWFFSEFMSPSRFFFLVWFKSRSFFFLFLKNDYHTLETLSSAKRWKNSQGAAVSSAVDKGDSKAVDEALEGKPEESHG